MRPLLQFQASFSSGHFRDCSQFFTQVMEILSDPLLYNQPDRDNSCHEKAVEEQASLNKSNKKRKTVLVFGLTAQDTR
jgi:hypothetical protein